MNDISKLKKSVVFLNGAIDEITTIRTYIDQITGLEVAAAAEGVESIDEAEKANYAEIIGDELDHVSRFLTMFVETSGINANEDEGGE